MKTYGEVDVYIHVFLILALVRGEWSALCKNSFTQGKDPSTNWLGGWVSSKVSLDDMEKWKFLTLLGLEL
jgi:hypothetical protein